MNMSALLRRPQNDSEALLEFGRAYLRARGYGAVEALERRAEVRVYRGTLPDAARAWAQGQTDVPVLLDPYVKWRALARDLLERGDMDRLLPQVFILNPWDF